jgi:hypothetical protein
VGNLIEKKDISVLLKMTPTNRCVGAIATYKNGNEYEKFDLDLLAKAFDEVEDRYGLSRKTNGCKSGDMPSHILWGQRLCEMLMQDYVDFCKVRTEYGNKWYADGISVSNEQKKALEKIALDDYALTEEEIDKTEAKKSLKNLGAEVRAEYLRLVDCSYLIDGGCQLFKSK